MAEKEVRLIDANALLDDIAAAVKNAGMGAVIAGTLKRYVLRRPVIDPESLRPQWISVKDRLPEKKSDVLMLFEFGNMAVGYWHDGDEDCTFWCAYTDDGFYTDCDSEPTHWMPLPEPPKED